MGFDTPLAFLTHPAPLPLARLPAGPKLLAAGIFAVGVSLITHPGPALLACLPPITLMLLSKTPLKAVLLRLLPVNALFLACWFLLPLALAPSESNGFSGLILGPLAFSASGLRLAALITLKGNAIAASLLLLAGTSPATASCRALLHARVPEKLVALLLLTHANLALMADEAAKITASARLRGFRPRPGFTAWRTLGYLAAMILLRSWQRSARVNQAMRLRGFTGRFPLLDPHAPPTAREARLAGLLVPVFLLITLFLVALNNAASPASLT